MDFDESPDEAAFRKEARGWLDTYAGSDEAPRRGPPRRRGRGRRSSSGPARGRRCWPSTAGRASPGRRSTAGRGGTAAEAAIFAEEAAALGLPTGAFAVGVAHGRAHDHRPRHRRAEGPLPGRRCCGARRSGASSSASPGAGSDLAGLVHPGRARRRRVGGQRPEGVDLRRPLQRLRHPAGPHRPRRPQAQGHHLLPDRHAPARRRGPARCARSPAPRTSARCSSPTPGCPHDAVLGEAERRVGRGHDHPGRRAGVHGRPQQRPHPRRPPGPGPGAGARPATRWCARAWPRPGPASRSWATSGMRVRTATSQGRAPGPEGSVLKLMAAWNMKGNAELALAIEGPAGMLAGDDGPRGRPLAAALPERAVDPHRRRQRRDPAQRDGRAGPRPARRAPRRQGRAVPRPAQGVTR